MNKDFSVEIVARGEGLVYRDSGRVLNFDVYWNREGSHWVFHAYACSDAQFHPVQLPPDSQKQIVARVVQHLESRGDRVEVLVERPPHPLRSIAEIMQERLSRRDTK